MKRKVIFILLICSSAIIKAQSLKLQTALCQGWVSESCGNYGSYYTLILESDLAQSNGVIDSLYIGTKVYRTFGVKQFSLTLSKEGNHTKHFVQVAEVMNTAGKFLETNPPLKAPPLWSYKGVALICYHVGNRNYTLNVEKFIGLPTKNY